MTPVSQAAVDLLEPPNRSATNDSTHRFRYRRLLEATCRLNQIYEIDELLQYLAQTAADLTDADRASIFLTEPARGALTARIALKTPIPLQVRLGEGIVGHVCNTGRPLVIPDAYADPRFNREVDAKTGFRTQNLACVPIRHHYRTPVGALQVLNKRSGSFDDADLDILTGLGANAALALDRVGAWNEREQAMAKLQASMGELTARVAQLDVLYELEQAIHREEDLDGFLRAAMDKLVAVFDAEAGSLLLAGEDRKTLYFLAASGPNAERLLHVSLAEGEGLVSWVHATGTPAFTNCPAEDPRFSPRVGTMMNFETRSILCVPVSCEWVRMGALEFCNRKGAPFTAADLKVAELIGLHLGKALARRQEQEARRSRARMETIGCAVQGIAHDLRAPLGNILHSARLLSADDVEPKLVRSLSSLFERQVRKCLGLTDDILDYSRGSLDYRPELVSTSELLEDLSEDVRHELLDRRIELRVDPGSEQTLSVDRRRLSRVFTNLVRNAARSVNRDGWIAVTVCREGDSAQFSFADSGAGVPAQLRPRLFQPFVSGSCSTGLGLAICRQIVNDHGGRIWLDESFGPGARFLVALLRA